MKRRGFTLIELMVVIAIIIILAAIAIPNYLSMTARAKRSRVASDFAAIATALETYKTDWNHYPIGTSSGESITTAATGVYDELTGSGSPALNNANATTPTGETGPIIYMTENILGSMKNPYITGDIAVGDTYQYISDDTGTTWTLHANTVIAAGTGNVKLERTDLVTTLVDASGT